MGNTYFSKSVSTLGSRRKWVYSLWVKRQKITDTQSIMMGLEDGSNYTKCQFNGTDRIEFTNVYGGGTTGQKITEAQYLDTNAWYHVYLVWNTLDPATADDRMQIWVNGVRCTDFNSSSNPGATTESAWNANPTDHYIGANDAGSNHLWGGYMAQVCSIDGTTPAVTVFGSFDATSGEWKPKSDGEIRSNVTFGTNGFLLTFENASYPGYDYQTTGRSTTFDYTKNGGGVQSQTNPSNTFDVLATSPGYKWSGVYTQYNAGTRNVATQGNAWRMLNGNIPLHKGKFYYECKMNSAGSGQFYEVGFTSTYNQALSSGAYNDECGGAVQGPAAMLDNRFSKVYYSTSTASGQKTAADYDTYDNGDIIGCAFDLDNGYMYWSKNGTWLNSADPTSGATGTGGHSVETGYYWVFSIASHENSVSTIHMALNMGEGSFPALTNHTQTAISSEGTNASGFGKFEYDVPAGYTAICTKGINTF